MLGPEFLILLFLHTVSVFGPIALLYLFCILGPQNLRARTEARYDAKEIKQQDGFIKREYDPFVYGYSVKIGPDGKPVNREFGNIKSGLGEEEQPLGIHERREPLVDVIENDKSIKVVAELPGVEKGDIKINATVRGLTIDVENTERKYFKELEFPVDIDIQLLNQVTGTACWR